MKKKIYGILVSPHSYGNNSGVQAHAVDGDTNTIIESHFCSNESMAKSDLGFTDVPIMDCIAGDKRNVHTTVYFHKKAHENYSKLYPEGYEMIWLGSEHEHDINYIEKNG